MVQNGGWTTFPLKDGMFLPMNLTLVSWGLQEVYFNMFQAFHVQAPNFLAVVQGHGSTVSLWCSWAEMELGAAGKESYRGREPPVFHNGGPVQHFTKTP